MVKCARRVLLTSTMALSVAALTQGASLELVSPGAAEKPVEIADRCPTFNWSAAETAAGFELVLYDLTAEVDDGAGEAEPVGVFDRLALPGAARGWTPSLDRCLEPGGSYAWTLRAVAEGELSTWAEPRMFTIRALPTAADVETALAVLDLYVEGIERGEMEPSELDRTRRRATTAPEARESVAGLASDEPSAPEGTGIAAIRGEVPDPTGETYGVEGISNSPDGAGLSAENTADATDLLLRGDGVGPDTRLTESALDRLSDSDQTFDVRNSGAGMMTLKVDGTDVVTTASDSDTLGNLACGPGEIAKWNGSIWECTVDENDDTLGGLSCASNQVPQWDGGAWVCANTGTDTLASLSCGPGQVVHWNGTVWVCGQPTLTHVTCSSSNSCSAACPASSIVWTGGCTATPTSATLIKSTPTSAGSGLPPTGWSCSAFNPLGGANVTVDLYCVSQ